jgi:uncharacterized protein
MAVSWFTHAAVPRSVPFALYILFLVSGPLVSGFDARWLYPVQVGLVALALAWFWRRYEELPRLRTLAGGHWALASVIGLLVFILWIQLDAPWMMVGEPGAGFDPRDDGRINVALALLRLAGAALVVPVMEELFWRSFVMRWIDKAAFLTLSPLAVSLKALLLSSAVFGLEHHLWFAGVIAGLAYGWLYRVSGNLWVPIISHAVTNGLLGIWVLYTGSWQFW